MSQRLFVATRKGLFSLNREKGKRGKWKFTRTSFLGSPVSMVLPDTRDRTLYAALNLGVSVGGVWHSENGGATWEVRAKGMFAEYMPPDRREDPVMQDPHRIVQSLADPDVLWCQHHNGVFRSADRGRTWESLTPQPSVFGFAAAAHPKDPKTAWLVPAIKDECRVPVGGKMVAARTRNGGRSFKTLRTGLPQKHAFDLVFRHGLDVDEEGKMLAMGSTTGSLWVSEDGGDSWKTVSANLPPVYCVRFEK